MNMFSGYEEDNKEVTDSSNIKNSSYCAFCVDSSFLELCFYCINCVCCTGCIYCENSSNLTSCEFCIGCSNLTGKKYCIDNVQYEEAEYLQEIQTRE